MRGNFGLAIRPNGRAMAPFSGQSRAPRYFRMEAAPGGSVRPWLSRRSRRAARRCDLSSRVETAARSSCELLWTRARSAACSVRAAARFRSRLRPSTARAASSRRRSVSSAWRDVSVRSASSYFERSAASRRARCARILTPLEKRRARIGAGDRAEVAESPEAVERGHPDGQIRPERPDGGRGRSQLGLRPGRLALGLCLLQFEDAPLRRLDLKVQLRRGKGLREVRLLPLRDVVPGPEVGETSPEPGQLALPLLDTERRGGKLRGRRRRRLGGERYRGVRRPLLPRERREAAE